MTASLHDPLPLTNVVQRYAWGSTDAIPRLLGLEHDGGPQAELWLGAHRSAPSRTQVLGSEVDLDTLVTEAPVQSLGHRVAEQFGPRLPYLLKVLAAGSALSLQVHPSPRHAREGFARENKAGLPAGSPERSFHDDQHKPEMLVAITQFEGLSGFRSPRTILELLDGLKGNLVDGVRDTLLRDRSHDGMRDAFHLLLSARADPDCRADIEVTLDSVRERLTSGSPFARADQTVVDLAEQHPGDPGAIASLMLNRFSLEPGESLFTPAGEVHAYLSGVGIEIMASSDNVLRAGLTSKHVDTAELLACVDYVAAPPIRTAPEVFHGATRVFYAPVDDFELSVTDLTDDAVHPLPGRGPRTLVCLEGQITVTSEVDALTLARGDAAFVPSSEGRLSAQGAGVLIQADVP